MKPSWKDAPDWAKFLAQDRSGRWYWYELEPTYGNAHGRWYDAMPGLGRSQIAYEIEDASADSLEARP